MRIKSSPSAPVRFRRRIAPIPMPGGRRSAPPHDPSRRCCLSNSVFRSMPLDPPCPFPPLTLAVYRRRSPVVTPWPRVPRSVRHCFRPLLVVRRRLQHISFGRAFFQPLALDVCSMESARSFSNSRPTALGTRCGHAAAVSPVPSLPWLAAATHPRRVFERVGRRQPGVGGVAEIDPSRR